MKFRFYGNSQLVSLLEKMTANNKAAKTVLFFGEKAQDVKLLRNIIALSLCAKIRLIQSRAVNARLAKISQITFTPILYTPKQAESSAAIPLIQQNASAPTLL